MKYISINNFFSRVIFTYYVTYYIYIDINERYRINSITIGIFTSSRLVGPNSRRMYVDTVDVLSNNGTKRL